MIKHIVMFKLRDFSEAEKAEKKLQLKKMLENLPAKIDLIKYFQVGINYASVSNAWDLVLHSEFTDDKDLNSYRVHPEHQIVVTFIKDITEHVAVVDYHI